MSLLVRNLNGQSTPHNTTLTIPLDDTLNRVLLPTSVLSNSLFCSVLFSFSMELGLPCIPELSQNRFPYLSLNFHVWRHIGHCWLACELSHLTMQCMWKQCEQAPQTSGQSSPGRAQSGQQPSKAIRQMPQLSSLASHFQTATPIQPLRAAFRDQGERRPSGNRPRAASNRRRNTQSTGKNSG